MKNAGIATGIFEGGYKRATDPGQLRGRFESEIRFRRLISDTPESKTHPPAKPRNTRKNPQSQAGRGFAGLSMGYEKDIFAVFAYEFELSQYDLYSSSTPSSKTASNSSSPRPSMMSLKRSIAMPIESVACFCFSLASKTSAIRLL